MPITALTDFYDKGEEFNGVLFCNTGNHDYVSKISSAMNRKQLKYHDNVVRFKRDSTMEERAPVSFLLGVRWQLGEWGFNKSAIKVNEKLLSMTHSGKCIATVRVDNGALIVDWEDLEWKEWTELHNSAEMQALIETANNKLKNSSEAKKGFGKGKKGKPGA